jgi:preprotein translocase subunit SecG
MFWIIGILTAFLVLDSLFLILLILVQLPKKEAGLGQAFGSAATDALFGAGSGNALTKLTKYVTVIFFVLTLSLSVMNAHEARSKKSTLEQALQRAPKEAPAAEAPAATAAKPAPVQPATPLATTPGGLLSTPVTGASTSAPAKPAPAPAAPAQKPAPAPAAGGAK